MKREPLFIAISLFFAASLPLFGGEEPPPCKGKPKLCSEINRWSEEGSAAGNRGDYYDNRDRKHSQLELKNFPQLEEVRYSEAEKIAGDDWAGQRKILPHVAIGNSSTAGPLGSNARGLYYTSDEGMNFLYSQYRSNNLYVYPAVGDYDPTPLREGGRLEIVSDRLPTNSPYLILSQGKSGSDKPFLEALFRTLASFRPEVKRALIEKGLLMPTLQQIMRMSYAPVKGKEEYLSGKAHPPAFDGKLLREEKMVELAHSMKMEAIPPLVILEEEGSSFNPLILENLASTPSAIAKVFRGREKKKKLQVTAKNSYDINNLPLTFHWIVLSGDKERISIKPSEGGKSAAISIDYQPTYRPDKSSELLSNRIDIGVFADNGRTLSAPAFITIYTLPNQLRSYDREGRLREIYYAASSAIYSVKNWKKLFELLEKGGGPPAKIFTDALNKEQIAYLLSKKGEILERQSALESSQMELQALMERKKRLGNNSVPWREIAAAKSAVMESDSALEKLLAESSTLPDKKSIREIISSAIEKNIENESLYSDNIEAIERGKRALEGKNRAAVRRFKEVQELAAEGKREKGRLIGYDKQQLKEDNLFLLGELLLPSILSYRIEKNYVDPRIDKPKEMVEEFFYDQSGNLQKISKKEVGR